MNVLIDALIRLGLLRKDFDDHLMVTTSTIGEKIDGAGDSSRSSAWPTSSSRSRNRRTCV